MALGKPKTEEKINSIEPDEESRSMRFIYAFLRHRRVVIILFALFTVLCALCIPLVNVNYDLASYLPQESKSTVSMNLMDEAYEADIPNARMYAQGLSLVEAGRLAQSLDGTEGIESQIWLGTQVDIKKPLEIQNTQVIDSWKTNEGYLYQLTIKSGSGAETLDQVRELAYQNGASDVALSGSLVTNVSAQGSTSIEVFYILIMAIVIIILVISLTSESWFEFVIFLLVLAMAIIMNMGTNIFKGEISFITQICAAVLQLAVSMDYAIVMLHTFRRYQKQYPDDPVKAMAHAMYKGFSVVLSSAAVTFFGFLSLSVMTFLIGADMGIVLAKGIFFSFFAVMFLMPCVILACQKPLKKFEHKPLLPSFDKFGVWCTRLMIPISIIVVIVAVPSFLGQDKTAFTYGAAGMIEEGTQLGDEALAIDQAFQPEETWVMLVPENKWADQKSLETELSQLPKVTGIISYTSMVGERIPTPMVPDNQLSQLISGGYSRIVIQTSLDPSVAPDYDMVETVRGIGEKYFGEESHLVGSQVTEYDLKTTTAEDSGRVKLFSVGAIALVLMIMFRSLSIPFVVLLPIQVSIWINLAIPYFTGASINYIGYLVVDAVQLGASVDYAIIYTREYLEQRRTYPAFQAARVAISKSAITIMTSAIILTIAGMSIFFIASNTLISEIGLLIGRGAFISMFMMFTLLPLLFILFDWIIRHTSIGLRFHSKTKTENAGESVVGKKVRKALVSQGAKTREATKMQQSHTYTKGQTLKSALGAVALSVTLIAGTMPTFFSRAYAETQLESQKESPVVTSGSDELNSLAAQTQGKEEVVYVKLSQTGKVEGSYVVNSFVLDKKTIIRDPGTYLDVINLSTDDELDNTGGKTTVEVQAGEFAYEGELSPSTEFPWKISISYSLDGKSVDPNDLSGASGALSMNLSITPQQEGKSIFADNYLVQASCAFSSDEVTNLNAEGGSIATAGSDYQLTFMALPKSTGDYTITADVKDFSFRGFTIAGVPLSMALDTEGFEDEGLGSDMTELKDAIAQIDEGAQSLKGGSEALAEGVSLLAANGQTLTDGSSQVFGGIATLEESVGQLAGGSSAFVSGIEAQAAQSYENAAAAAALAEGKQGEYVGAMTQTGGDLTSAYGNLYAASQAQTPEELAAALAALQGDLDGMQVGLGGISSAIGTDTELGLIAYQAQASAYSASADTSMAIASAYADLNTGIQSFFSAMPELIASYAVFDEGVQSYVGGVNTLNDNYCSYTQGMQAFTEGTTELRNQTVDIDTKLLEGIKEQLNDYLDPQYELHSFVAPSNKNVERVQFIYMSDPIEEPQKPEPEVEEPEEETVWSRVLDLFK